MTVVHTYHTAQTQVLLSFCLVGHVQETVCPQMNVGGMLDSHEVCTCDHLHATGQGCQLFCIEHRGIKLSTTLLSLHRVTWPGDELRHESVHPYTSGTAKFKVGQGCKLMPDFYMCQVAALKLGAVLYPMAQSPACAHAVLH